MDFLDMVKRRLKTILSVVWGVILDYYSLLPFWKILLFNCTVPLGLIFIFSAQIPTELIYIAANGIFYGLLKNRSSHSYERKDSKTVLKQFIITVITAFAVCITVGLALLVYFISNLDKFFP